MLALWKENYDKPRQCIKKQRYHFADKGPYRQSYGFSNSHVWMWKLGNLKKRLSDKELMPSNCDARENYWGSLGQ